MHLWCPAASSLTVKANPDPQDALSCVSPMPHSSFKTKWRINNTLHYSMPMQSFGSRLLEKQNKMTDGRNWGHKIINIQKCELIINGNFIWQICHTQIKIGIILISLILVVFLCCKNISYNVTLLENIY